MIASYGTRIGLIMPNKLSNYSLTSNLLSVPYFSILCFKHAPFFQSSHSKPEVRVPTNGHLFVFLESP